MPKLKIGKISEEYQKKVESIFPGGKQSNYINGREVEKSEFLLSQEPGQYIEDTGIVYYRKMGIRFHPIYQCEVEMMFLHREDGPAQIYPYQQMEWWFNGELHRDVNEGPAIVFPNGRGDYWIQGRRLEDWKQKWLNKWNWTRRFMLWLFKKRWVVPVAIFMVSGN